MLNVYGTAITVVVAHNGQGSDRSPYIPSSLTLLLEEDIIDRQLQSAELARIMSTSPNPIIYLGYAVTKPKAPRRKWSNLTTVFLRQTFFSVPLLYPRRRRSDA